jgi:hypothetical protein
VISAATTIDLGDVTTTVTDVVTERPGVLIALGIALAVILWTPTWRLTRMVVTIAHEGGHAVFALVAGRGLTGIRLHPDTSGLTVSTGAPAGPGLVFTFLGGYPMPSLLGLGAAWLVAAGNPGLMLVLSLVLLAATLIAVRNVYGGLAIVATGAVIGAVVWWGTPRVQDHFAAALCWFLLIGGLRAVRELQRGLRRRRSGVTDAEMLARLTRLPTSAWAATFWVVSGACLAGGAWILLVAV